MADLRNSRPCPSAPRRFVRHGMLPQLAAFEAVVRFGSATRAAEALCMAQPTLSGHLRKLSEALGVRLFERHGKRLVPTSAALVLLQAAHEVFAAFERCDQTLLHLQSAAPSRFDTPGVSPSVPSTLADAALPSVAHAAARSTTHLHSP